MRREIVIYGIHSMDILVGDCDLQKVSLRFFFPLIYLPQLGLISESGSGSMGQSKYSLECDKLTIEVK